MARTVTARERQKALCPGGVGTRGFRPAALGYRPAAYVAIISQNREDGPVCSGVRGMPGDTADR